MASSISAGTTTSTGLVCTADTSGALQLATNNGTTALTLDTSQNATFVGSATVNTIKSAAATALTLQSAGTTAVTFDTSQNATFAGYANLPNTFGFKNRIINGAMVIDQRNAGAATANTISGYTVDRWQVVQSPTTGKVIGQQNAGSVTPPTGFNNYYGITSQSAFSIVAGSIYTFIQPIEGFNFADLGWGTASAATATLSFWVRSSLTGTFGGSLGNGSSFNRSYPFTYTISSANTWEYKTITIAGDTTGTWAGATNGIGVYVNFGLGVGSTYSGTAGAWAGADYRSATGGTSVVGTNGATFYITGVQFEKGSTATSFDYRSIGTELALCQRYFEMSYNIGTVPASSNTTQLRILSWAVNGANGGNGGVTFQVSKRAAPTVTTYDGAGTVNTVSTSTAAANPSFTNGYAYQGAPGNISTSGFIHWGQGIVGNVYNYIHFTASAEL